MPCYDETMKLMADKGFAASSDLQAYARLHCARGTPPKWIVRLYVAMDTLEAFLEAAALKYVALEPWEMDVLVGMHLGGVDALAIYAKGDEMLANKKNAPLVNGSNGV